MLKQQIRRFTEKQLEEIGTIIEDEINRRNLNKENEVKGDYDGNKK